LFFCTLVVRIEASIEEPRSLCAKTHYFCQGIGGEWEGPLDFLMELYSLWMGCVMGWKCVSQMALLCLFFYILSSQIFRITWTSRWKYVVITVISPDLLTSWDPNTFGKNMFSLIRNTHRPDMWLRAEASSVSGCRRLCGPHPHLPCAGVSAGGQSRSPLLGGDVFTAAFGEGWVQRQEAGKSGVDAEAETMHVWL
jgi:hypothetical protein